MVLDYATLENVEVEYVMETDGQMSSPTKSTPLTFKLLMTKNSDGRSEQISLVADSRYCSSFLSVYFKKLSVKNGIWKSIFRENVCFTGH